MRQKTFETELEVGPSGKVEINVPFPEGTKVGVIVYSPEHDDFSDLRAAAASSFEFWDNPLDDEDWNNA